MNFDSIQLNVDTVPKAVETELSPEQQRLNEITERLVELEQVVRDFEHTKIDPYAKMQKEFTELENSLQDELLMEMRKLREAFNDRIQEARDQANKANAERVAAMSELQQLKYELNGLSRDKMQLLAQIAAQEKIDELQKRIFEIIEDAPWRDKIKDFQLADLLFMINAYEEGLNGVMNANDMSLGKTMETTCFLWVLRTLFYREHDRLPRVLWLTKRSLMKTTHREINKWDPDIKAVFIQGNPEQRRMITEMAVQVNALVICNYDALNTTPALINTEWDIIVADEVQRLKGGANPSGPTLLWQKAKEVVENCKFFIPLSGSPINNHPRDMWAYLHLFDAERFPTVKRFEREYCYGYGSGAEVDFEKLITTMSKQVIRRRKSEVLKDLPDKTRSFRYVEMNGCQKDIYEQMRDRFFVWLDSANEKSLNATAIIAQLTRLRQIAAFPGSIVIPDPVTGEEWKVDCQESAKIDEAMEIISELRAAGENVVIFSSQFNGPLHEVARRVEAEGLGPVEIIEGSTVNKVDEIQQRFQQNETHVLCINAKTGGEGLNLHRTEEWPGGASHSIFLDLWWNPMFNTQAEDRIHRQGAINPVTIHIIQAENSVDDYIASILDTKSAMIEGIMESEALRPKEWKERLQGLI